GKTNDQAAQALGCPAGSMSARLNQARERLRAALARRGYAVAGTGIAAALSTAASAASVPLPLAGNTLPAAAGFAGGHADRGGFISAGAVALARGACRAMFVSKVKIIAAALLIAVLLGAGTTMLLTAATPPRPPSQASPLPAPAAPGERLPVGVVARL